MTPESTFDMFTSVLDPFLQGSGTFFKNEGFQSQEGTEEEMLGIERDAGPSNMKLLVVELCKSVPVSMRHVKDEDVVAGEVFQSGS